MIEHPGKLLCKKLAELKMTPTELAKKIGVKSKCIYNLLHGKQHFNPVLAKKISSVTNTKPVKWMDLQKKFDVARPKNIELEKNRKFIRENYQTMSVSEMSRQLGKSTSYPRYVLFKMGLENPREVRVKFFKGIGAEWMKDHRKYKPGDVYIKANRKEKNNAYKYIVLDNCKHQLLQRHNWIKKYGEIPKDYVVWFKDGNSLNCDPDNLELVTYVEKGKRLSARLADASIAAMLSTGYMQFDRPLYEELLKHPELLELKRQQLILKKTINDHARNQKSP